jgi:tetratricopeptide (TPR) repeat protein
MTADSSLPLEKRASDRMSSARWFYSADDQPRGPVPLEQLLELLRSGQLPSSALVWRQGMEEWTRADAVPEILPQLRSGAPGAARAGGVEADAAGAKPKAPPPPSTAAPEAPKKAPPGRVEARPAPSAAPPAAARAKPEPAKSKAGVGAKPASAAAVPGGENKPEPKAAKAEAKATPTAAPPPAAATPAIENPFIAKLREAYALNSRVFAQLAEELRKEGDLDGAIQVCREGLKKHPGYVMARVTMGRALTQRGDLPSARSVLEPVLAAQPDSSLARRALGECLERMGRTEEALEQYRSGLALDPDNDWLRDRIDAVAAAALQKPAAGEAPSRGEAPSGEPPASEEASAVAEPPAEGGAETTGVDEAADWERRAPDEDLPPIPLVAAEESFELENPYDIPSVWKEEEKGEKAPPESVSAPLTAKAEKWPLHPLEDLTLPDLLQQLNERGFTGVLALRREGAEKTLRFEEGQIVFATTSDPDERMGELLLTRGRITAEQYEKASQAVRERGVRLGEALVEAEALGPYQQVEVVTDHIRSIALGLFRWVDGSYQLREGLLEAHEAITLEMTLPEVLLGGIRGIDAWSRVVRGAGGLDARYLPAGDLESRLGPLTLSPQQRALLDFKEPRSARTLCRDSALADFDVLKTLWAFRVAGILTRLPADSPGA